jgi:hypothetical protein
MSDTCAKGRNHLVVQIHVMHDVAYVLDLRSTQEDSCLFLRGESHSLSKHNPQRGELESAPRLAFSSEESKSIYVLLHEPNADLKNVFVNCPSGLVISSLVQQNVVPIFLNADSI